MTPPPAHPAPIVRRAIVAVSATALTLSFALAGAGAAHASPVVRMGPVAPGCVRVISQGHTWAGLPKVTIRNDCSTTKRVKIVWANTPDSGCKVLSRGEKASDWTGLIGRFAGLQLC